VWGATGNFGFWGASVCETFYWGENRVKISLLFLTLETLDFKSEHVFESHGQLQSSADIMTALTSY
jgi:hypothetical protein